MIGLPKIFACTRGPSSYLLHTSSVQYAQLHRFHITNKNKTIEREKRRRLREEAPHTNPSLNLIRRKESNPSFRRRGRPRNEVTDGETSWARRLRGEAMEAEGSGGRRVSVDNPQTAQATDASVRRDETRIYEVDKRSVRLSRPSKPTNAPAKKVKNDLTDTEFSKEKTISDEVPQFSQSFTSPPLLPGLLSCLEEILGPDPAPTPIQASSLTWLLNNRQQPEHHWKQFLLASETGSGKSIAYLLPLLQHLKIAECERRTQASSFEPQSSKPKESSRERELMPRALILAPTHELSRQLSKTAKSLLHQVKLRVRCASQANLKSAKQQDFTARQLAAQFNNNGESELGTFEVGRKRIPADILVGTPMKVMEMYKGRGWNRQQEVEPEGQGLTESKGGSRSSPTRSYHPSSAPPLGLQNIEWVVIDEADVLLDPDFEQTTRQLLADISAARGHPVPYSTTSSLSLSFEQDSAAPTPIEYPFNFILTSATIPSALARYLDQCHPNLLRLASPRLHALPKSLKTEYVGWTGGNKNADIERRLRQVWADDSVSPGRKGLSKVLIFCNKNTKIDVLASYLEGKGIKNIALSRDGDQRKWGNNHHLDGFVKKKEEPEVKEIVEEVSNSDPQTTPHVMITTSLLSRGIDFSPSVKHVFIVDEPRNMIDFLHRAGRTGRAGEGGKVVIFGRIQGRGSLKSKEIRQKVNLLSMIR